MRILKNKLFYVIAVTTTLFISSCADDPNSVGNSLIPDTDKLDNNSIVAYVDSLSEDFVAFEKDISFFGSSSKILLGKYENLTSEVLISFTIILPDSVSEHLENGTADISSSWVELFPNYWIGDNNQFSFSAREIKTSWTSIKIDQDTIDNIRANIGPDVLESIDYESGDTLIKFTLSEELISNWVNVLIDESLSKNYGVLLSPDENSNSIAGFQALTSFPVDPYPQLHIVFEFNGTTLDTISANPRLDMHVVTGERIINPLNEVILQDALGIRGKLKFNLSDLPNNILVNSAIFDLYYNDSNSFEGSIETDTIALSFYHDFETDSVNTSFGRYPLVKKDGKYTGEIRQFVQRWIMEEPNEGLELNLSDGSRSASAISFYGSNFPNKSLRPKLTIYYTTK